MDFISAEKVRKSASSCFIDVTIELNAEEVTSLIEAHPGNSPLKRSLSETRGFHSLSRVGATSLIIVRYDGPAHPLNVTPEMVAESGNEIFVAVQSVANEILGS